MMTESLPALVDRKALIGLGLSRAAVDHLFQAIAAREGVIVFGRKPYVPREAVERELRDRTFVDGARVRA